VEKWGVYAAAAAAFCICGGWGYRQGQFERSMLSDEGLARRGIRLERVEGPERFSLVYYCHSRIFGAMSLVGRTPFVEAGRTSTQHRFLAPLSRSLYGYAVSIFRSPTIPAANGQRLQVLGEARSHHKIVLGAVSGRTIGYELAMNGRQRCDGPAVLATLHNPRLWRERLASLSRDLAFRTYRNALEKRRRGTGRTGSTPPARQLFPIALRALDGPLTLAELDLLTRANATLERELRSPFTKVVEGAARVLAVIGVLTMIWLLPHLIRMHREH
jgi:hypothetical protein